MDLSLPHLTRDDYTVACICPMGIELAAVEAMLDEIHPILPSSRDKNNYTLGRMEGHNIVIAVMPEIGNNSAASVATQLMNDFKSIRFGLLVGIGGGIPDGEESDVRLGDIVVSKPTATFGGVVQFDRGKAHSDGRFELTGTLQKPPTVLMATVQKLEALHWRVESKIPAYLSQMLQKYPKMREHYIYQGIDNDQLFEATYSHQGGSDCRGCNPDKAVKRTSRNDSIPKIHYGTIGSANIVVKDSATRENLKKDLGILCVEMEAAGLMDEFSCIVIRGICDYADSHKNKRWQPYAAATAAAYAKELLSIIPAQAIVATTKAVDAFERSRGLLELLASNYKEHKDRNPERVPGTCEWFLGHRKFLSWREKKTASLLWVSADPGCGKSVLSKALVDEGLLTSAPRKPSICYFFFKDDDVDRQSSASALCAILHQLFIQKPKLMEHAMGDYNKNGKVLRTLFSTLWDILQKSTTDPEAGEIICVFDALDECEASARKSLIGKLGNFYSTRNETSARLKVIVTSRPYSVVERDFRTHIKDLNSICLKGEEESEKIRREINLVIEDQIPRISNAMEVPLELNVQSAIVEHLKSMENRTYLWLYLILDVIRDTLESTQGKLKALVDKIPDSVDDAYETILNRVKDREGARRLLHIVVAAARPLTLREIIIAMEIDEKQGKKENCRSVDELELDENEKALQIKIRNLCGLFVSVIDSKIYLIHQTAKNFLIRKDTGKGWAQNPSSETWKHSLDTEQSNFKLSKICLSYIVLDVCESQPLVVEGKYEHDHQCTKKHVFLDYSAKNWAIHLRGAGNDTDTGIVELILEICDTHSKRFRTWFPIYWPTMQSRCPRGFTDLTVGCYFGLNVVVRRLLENGADKESKDDTYGRTPLSWAALNGHEATVKQLLFNGCDLNPKDMHGQTPLSLAARNGHQAIVELLLGQRGDPNISDSFSRTSLSRAAEKGYGQIVKLLLDKGANPNSEDRPLGWAVRNGHEEVVRLLLQHRADPLVSVVLERRHRPIIELLLEKVASSDSRHIRYCQALLPWASGEGNKAVVELLLKSGADVNFKDCHGRTALSRAVEKRNEAVIMLLLERGADLDSGHIPYFQTLLPSASWEGNKAVVEHLLKSGADVNFKDCHGRTALSRAGEKRNEAVITLLLERGADLDSGHIPYFQTLLPSAMVKLLLRNGANANCKDSNGRTVLSRAAEKGNEAVVRLLLEGGAEVNSKDNDGRTALSWAASSLISMRRNETMKLLLESGAEVNSKDNDGRTALSRAAEKGYKTVTRLLLESGAEVNSEDNDDQTAWSRVAERMETGLGPTAHTIRTEPSLHKPRADDRLGPPSKKQRTHL